MDHSYDKEVLGSVIKGFELVPAPEGFGHPFITKNGKATPQLARRINDWIVKTFPASTLRVNYEGTYSTLNFGRKKT